MSALSTLSTLSTLSVLSTRSPLRGAGSARRRLGVLTAAVALAVPALAGVGLTQQPADGATRKSAEPFSVATFNLLGASHTKTARRGFDPYGPRMRRAVALMERRSLDIVGFQEFQKPQHDLFVRLTAGSWKVWPGLELGRRPVQNSIVWRSADWEAVEKRVYTIPYFSGKLVKEPYVKLRNRHDGLQVWVINTHNPADSRGPAQRYRDRAVQIQIDLANKLEQTGAPVFLTGDFNDRDEAFCPITASTNLKAAAPGGGWSNGRCQPPRYTRVDWVFLAKRLDVLGYTLLDNAETDAITDHPVVWAEIASPLS